jgi:hypothetical protein
MGSGQQMVNEFFELGVMDRLCNVGIAAGIQRQAMKVGCIVGGDSNDGDATQFWHASNLPSRGYAVNKREAQIHQNDLRLYFNSNLDSFPTVERFDNPKTAHLQQSSHHLAIVFSVLNQQNRRDRMFRVHGVNPFVQNRFGNRIQDASTFSQP